MNEEQEKIKELRYNKFQMWYIPLLMKVFNTFYEAVFMMGWDYGKMGIYPKFMIVEEEKEQNKGEK